MAEFAKDGGFCPNLTCSDYENIERSCLTMRTFSSSLTRKAIAFSKSIDMHKASAVLEDIYYNFVKLLKTLRLKWLPRTQATAAGLTDNIWTLKEVVSMVMIRKQLSKW